MNKILATILVVLCAAAVGVVLYGFLFAQDAREEVVLVRTGNVDELLLVGDVGANEEKKEVEKDVLALACPSAANDTELAENLRAATDGMQGEIACMLFGGDVMLDRHMRTLIAQHGSAGALIAPVKQLFRGWDSVVWNLEGTVSERASISVGQPQNSPAHFKFSFAPKDVQDLVDAVDSPAIINDANNHMLDFGYDGLNETRENLHALGLPFFGDVRGESVAERVPVLRQTVGGRAVSFVSYNHFFGADPEIVATRIAEETALGRDVIVYTHWGTEYERGIESGSQRIARQFVDAGARLVIGSHPHVAQPIETYRDGVIFYSLGNLLFDQFFSVDVTQRPVVGCALTDTEIICAITPLEHIRGEGLQFQDGTKRDVFFDWLTASSLDNAVNNELKRGIIRIKGAK